MRKKIFIELYPKYLGSITAICKEVNIARKTFYEWYRNDEEFKSEIDSISIDDVKLDLAEHQLHSLMKDKNFPAIKFFLENKGGDRGYGKDLSVKMEVDNKQMQLDVMEAIRSKHSKKDEDS